MNKLYLISIVCISLIACSTPYEDGELPVADLFSVHCTFQEASHVYIKIGKLKSPLDTFYKSFQDNLDVTFISNNTFYKAIPIVSVGDPFITYSIQEAYEIDPLRNYTIHIQNAGVPIINSSIVVPNPQLVELSNERIIDNSLIDNTVQTVHCEVNFSDLLEEANYYHLIATKILWRTDLNGVPIQDPNILENLDVKLGNSEILGVVNLDHEPGILFTDRGQTNGKTNTLKLTIKTKNSISHKKEFFKEINLEFRSVSREYYLYHKSVTEQILNNKLGIPALEPIVIFSNITGGTGVFCAYNSSNRTFSTGK